LFSGFSLFSHSDKPWIQQMGPTRSRLIEKGLLFTPGHGLAALTVPQFDRFMRRTYSL
jgi:hypothetical protein